MLAISHAFVEVLPFNTRSGPEPGISLRKNSLYMLGGHTSTEQLVSTPQPHLGGR